MAKKREPHPENAILDAYRRPQMGRVLVRNAVVGAILRYHGLKPTDRIPNTIFFPRNRGEARRHLRRKSPWMHFTVIPSGKEQGRSRRKRNEARERASL